MSTKGRSYYALNYIVTAPNVSKAVVCSADEDAKRILETESTNRSLLKELEQVKSSLKETEKNLRACDQQKSGFQGQLRRTLLSLSTVMKDLQSVVPNVRSNLKHYALKLSLIIKLFCFVKYVFFHCIFLCI